MAHKETEDCNCELCYTTKRGRFALGEKGLTIDNKEIEDFIDIAILKSEDGAAQAYVGINQSVKVSHLMIAIGALARAAHAMIGVEVQLDANPQDKH